MDERPFSLTDHFAPLARRYDAVLSDVWGVVHNGVAAFSEACEALMRFREAGGTVVLISNAPRPGHVIRKQLDHFAVPRAAYDEIVTSGDVTQHYMASRPGAIYHLGPARDLSNFIDVDVRLGPIEEADYIVCTGLFDDETETPDDYADILKKARERGLLMLCANPDLVVERGEELLYCAGALADRYQELGGEVHYAGKPHAPIYHEAVAKVANLRGAEPARERMLAIGDSVRTDVTGAAAFGIDCLFVTGGIHAEEIGGRAEPDLDALATIFAAAGTRPAAITRRLRW